MLSALRQAFDARAVEIQQTAVGIDPEQVIVIETIGSIENFAGAVSRVEGLEWLGELEIDEIAPDDDFYRTKKDKSGNVVRVNGEMKGRLYLVMTNNRALNQLLSLWTQYQRNQNMKWPTGLTKFRDAFLFLHDIRRWGIQDRLQETGVLHIWQEDLTHFPNDPVKLEIELWFRRTPEQRQSAENSISQLVTQAGGRLLHQCVIQDIAYHALLAELPRREIERIVQDPTTELVKSDSIMFFRPVGQMAAGKESVEGEVQGVPSADRHSYPTGDPVVAIFDGLPMENHVLLADRLIIEDPDDYAPEYQVRDRVHGTAMCSLIVWGDLNDGQPPLTRPVYVRPIMKPVRWHSTPWPEEVPRELLPVDLIHRAVRRLFEGEGNEAPAAATVKIINLSIGDPSRPFYQLVSPIARLLDWLSAKYGVLFIVSAGNQRQDIDLGINESQFQRLSSLQREELVIRQLYEDARNRRIFAPAESINGITVNAIHGDKSTGGTTGRLIDVFSNPLPSPISAFGSGYRRSIKPDISFPGGRVLYNYSPTGSSIQCFPRRVAPGIQVAAPGTQPGDLSKIAFGAGTSNSAALVTRTLGICYDDVLNLFETQASDIDPSTYIAPLLKVMIVHACSWDETGEKLRSVLCSRTDGRSVKHWISQWLGYGVPQVDRVTECTEQRATVLGFGQVTDGAGHVFHLPLPPSLGARTDRRRLSVTLAWMSPIAPTTQKYRTAALWFDVPGRKLTPTRINADHNAVRRGTVQHEVFEGNDAIVITSGDWLTVKVNCRGDADQVLAPVTYGLAVTLEVAEGISIPIYDEIRTRIRPRVDIRARNTVPKP
ncbi:MAG: S8 family peptidase [Planctomycetota bacterium]|nr:S8 family peptidase [Planctomycetota bacterium]